MGNLLIGNSFPQFVNKRQEKAAGPLPGMSVLFSQYLYILDDLEIVATAIKMIGLGIRSV